MALESITFVESGNIQSIWHDLDTQTLVIRYHHQNRVYKYFGVSGEDANGFSQSLSANDYLDIIKSKYTGEFIGSLPVSADGDDIAALTNLLA